jgi:hypothetical protein
MPLPPSWWSSESRTSSTSPAGAAAGIPPHVEKLIAGTPESGTVDAHAIQPFYAGLVARDREPHVHLGGAGDEAGIEGLDRVGVDGAALRRPGVLNLVVIAVTAIPRGGVIDVSITGEGDAPVFVLGLLVAEHATGDVLGVGEVDAGPRRARGPEGDAARGSATT